MTLTSPASALYSWVVANNAEGWTAKRDLFDGHGYPLPQGLAAQFLDAPSQGPDPYLNGATPQAYVRAQVQILVWGIGGADGHEASRDMAFAMASLLQQATVAGFVSVRLASMPTLVGDPKAPRHAWSINVQAEQTV